jgi:hypothetical protein
MQRTSFPWLVLGGEAAVLGGGAALSWAGSSVVLPSLLLVLAAVDAVLLFHPASPMTLRRTGSVRGGRGGTSGRDGRRGSPEERTERLGTAGVVTRMGILSEGEPGTPDEADRRRWFILVDEFMVGRDADRADLVPDGPGVSRTHARLRRLGDSFTIEDLSARNGTYVDERRLDPGEERVLPDRCTVRFASNRYYFRVE